MLAAFMAALTDLEHTVHPDLRVYVLRPRGQIETPAIYNLIPEGQFQRLDTMTGEDTLTVVSRIAVARTSPDEEADDLLRYTDAFLAVIDVALWNTPPGGADQCRRTAMRLVPDDQFNEISALSMEFALEIKLTRPLQPTP